MLRAITLIGIALILMALIAVQLAHGLHALVALLLQRLATRVELFREASHMVANLCISMSTSA